MTISLTSSQAKQKKIFDEFVTMPGWTSRALEATIPCSINDCSGSCREVTIMAEVVEWDEALVLGWISALEWAAESQSAWD